MTTTNDLIRQVVDQTGLDDPRQVAEKVAEITPDEQVRDFYARMLVQEVRVFFSSERRRAFDAVKGKQSGRKALGPARTKVSVVRDWWSEFCSSRVHVGDSVWKSLGECTFEDLRALHDERVDHAERTLSEAQRFDLLAKLLEEDGVSRVCELDSGRVRGLFV